MFPRFVSFRFLGLSLTLALVLSACASQAPALPPTTEPGALVQPTAADTVVPGQGDAAAIANPASVFCNENGGTSEIRTAADGSQTGICVFDDGTECDEWAFYRGECDLGPIIDSADEVEPTPIDIVRDQPPAVSAAIMLLTDELKVNPSDISVKDVQEQDWPDACLGLALSDEVCAQMIVPGYQVTLTVAGQDYVIRTSQTGDIARFDQ